MKEYHPGLEGYHPGLEGVIATESSISDINGEKGILSYRGYSIEDLAKKTSFEETSYLLLTGDLPSKSELDSFTQKVNASRELPNDFIKLLKNEKIKIIGVQPTEGSRIPGIRRWKSEYVPEIFQQAIVDQIIDISQQDAEISMVNLSQRNGLFVGVSAGANVHIAKKIASELENSIIVTILCDRGDRYLSKI